MAVKIEIAPRRLIPSYALCITSGESDSHSESNRCRYKTGKCSNMRSQKRNGQPHHLCRYHREKANRIQRKFDRQKRESGRTRKMAQRESLYNTRNDGPRLSHTTPVSSDKTLFSDSDSSRFSKDSDVSMLGDIWKDIPKAVVDFCTSSSNEGGETTNEHFSYDELVFLRSAIMD
uniref:Uncharacterized protein AlNc14C28G2700 n=1 Tax=Albugo laibachii Nc14 TaxID=890382 RepID=F0W772_9STRA|nr:conserved hypothetical protein [Albugo laibachii Nc14]|eukprot:CCA16971.1 conserved hypothetical protein [Albugo laibachii Nc14]